MKKLSLIFVVTSFACLGAASKPTIRELVDARFSEYTANPTVPPIKAKQLDFSGNPKAKKYRTNIKRYFQSANQPNFAGRFVMVDNIGCGTACVLPFIIDFETGKIFSVPSREQPIHFRSDSKLIVTGWWSENFTLEACGHMLSEDPYLLIFEAGKFHPASEQICPRLKK